MLPHSRPSASNAAAAIPSSALSADFPPTAPQASLASWCAQVRRIVEALERAQSRDDIAHWSHALNQAARDYAGRRFEPVRSVEALRANAALAVCLAKHARLDGCAHALSRLAREFAALDVRLSAFDGIDALLLCDLVYAYSRLSPADAHAQMAIRELADEVRHRLLGDARYFNAREKTDLLAWFGLHEAHAGEAMRRLRETAPPRLTNDRPAPSWFSAADARQPRQGARMGADDTQGMAARAKALSKQPKSPASLAGIEAIIRRLLEQAGDDASLGCYSWRELNYLANALAKFTNDKALGRNARGAGQESTIDAGLIALAKAVATRKDTLGEANAIDLSLLVNGFSKLAGDAGEAACNAALRLLAEEVARRKGKDFKTVELSNLVNGFSKLAGDAGEPACNAALRLLAEEVARRTMKDFKTIELSNLVNGFSKLAGDTGEAACNAALRLLAEEVSQRTMKDFSAVHLSNLVNGFSKLAGDAGEAACNAALRLLAEEVALRTMKDFNAIALSNLVNGFSKLAGDAGEAACNAALRLLAEEVARRKGEDFKTIELSNLVNGFSKLAGDAGEAACNAALRLLAEEAARRTMKDFDAIALSNLVNGFSKLAGDAGEAACNAALRLLAEEAARRTMEDFSAIALSNLVNGFSKLTSDAGEAACNAALRLLAEEVALRTMKDFNAIALSNLVNGFSKLAGDAGEAACNAALRLLAEEVSQRTMKDFNAIALSNLVNGFSKLAGDAGEPACNAALRLLAEEVARRTMKDFKTIELSNLVNGFSKLAGDTGEAACNAALRLLAEEVSQRTMKDFSAVHLSNLVNGFSKLAGDGGEAACNAALRLLAEEVSQRTMKDFSAVHLSNLVNGFAKLVSDSACRDAIALIAAHLAAMDDAALRTTLTSLEHRGPLCNALGLCARAERDPETGQPGHAASACAAALERTVASLLTLPPEATIDDLLDFALLLRGLQRAELSASMHSVAQHCWPRLLALVAGDKLATESLETLGTLCTALTPLARSRAAPALRKQALALLVHTVLPAAWRKLALHATDAAPSSSSTSSTSSTSSAPSAPSTPSENFTTRIPEYSYYAIARAGAEAARFWTRRNTAAEDRRHLAATRTHLIAQSREVWTRLAAINNGDISRYSWNLIAQLEAESPSTILDDFVAKHWDSIRDQPPPARFDWNRVFDEIAGEPHLPPQGKGIVTVPRSDFAGHTPRDADPQPRYSILARLSEGKLPMLQVDLPTVLTPFLLGRAVHRDGVAYRVDVTGGSGMKPARKTVEQVFAAAELGENAPCHDAAGKLYALRVTDTGPGADFARLMETLFPYTEAYYYFQRALMSSPPAIAAAHGPAAHVLEGRFRIAVLPDRQGGQHPFQLRDAQDRPIALQPHDGMGFIRESVAQRYPWHAALTKPGAQPFGGTARQANLPPDALQHYARDEQAAAEVAGTLPRNGEAAQRFRALTQGARSKGHIAKAVPAAGTHVVLPASKPATDALLLGRAPYEAAKLQPVPNAQVQRGDDATARFLDASPWLQYSHVCRRPDGALSFFKGGLMVVPEAQWPARYADRHLVFSAEDEKSRSSWREAKARHGEDAVFDAEAMLVITEAYAPGSCVAVPLPLQKAMGGDYDGDDVLLVSGMPALHAAVCRHQALHIAPELKLPKTHTPAYRDGAYYLGRAGQIAATRLNVLGRYTLLQRRLLLLPEARQQELAQTVLTALCREGLDKTLEAGLEALLDAADAADVSQAQALLSELERRAAHSHGDEARRCFAGIAADVRALPAGRACADEALRLVLPSLPLQPLSELPTDPRERLALWLEHMPWAGPQLPEAVWQAHLRGQARDGLASLLMLGIKAGEDAYKSDTGVRLYDRIGKKLERLYAQEGIGATVPYSRQTMHLLLQDRFDAETAHAQRALLAQGPNLAAAVMQDTLGQWLSTGPQARRASGIGIGTATTIPIPMPTTTAHPRPNVNTTDGRMNSEPASRKRQLEAIPERQVRPRIERQAAAAPAPLPDGTRKRGREEEVDERRVRQRTDAGVNARGDDLERRGPARDRAMPRRPGQ